jgi:hypothetical protein
VSLAARLCEQFIEFVVDTLHGGQDTVQSGIDGCPVQLPVFGRGFRYYVDFLSNVLGCLHEFLVLRDSPCHPEPASAASRVEGSTRSDFLYPPRGKPYSVILHDESAIVV